MRGKFLCMLFLLMAVTILCNVPGFAVEVRESDQILYSTATLAKANDGNLTVVFSIVATGSMDTLGAKNVVVQRYNGTQWITEHTFTVKNTPELQTSNRSSYSAAIQYSPNYSGSSYRASILFYAKVDSQVSTAIVTTNTV